MHRLAVAVPHTITDVLEKEAVFHHYDPAVRDAGFIEHLDMVFADITPDISADWLASPERAAIEAVPSDPATAQSTKF